MSQENVNPEPMPFTVEGKVFIVSYHWDRGYLFPSLSCVDDPSSFLCEAIGLAWWAKRLELLESLVSEASFSHPFFSIHYNRDATDWELACGVTDLDEEHEVVCTIPFFQELVRQFAIRCYDTMGRSNCQTFSQLSPAVQKLLSHPSSIR